MKNIHLLPTEKLSRLMIDTIENKLYLQPILHEKTINVLTQHIYIISDEEIKFDEYYLGEDSNIYCLVSGVNYNGKKIILTTDQELIEEGIQAIDDEFLEWFVKNIDCGSVKVERLDTFKKTNEVYVDEIAGGNYYEIIKQYKIIIPQEEPKQKKWDRLHKELDNALEEEPKQDPTLENSKLALREYILANKEKVTEDLQEMREKSDSGRDETLEEAALSFLPRSEVEHDTDFITGFEFGANWMAERMYSEEELKNAIEISVAKALGVMSFTINEESFEQFKKKQHIK
jgi:hypothetical protein